MILFRCCEKVGLYSAYTSCCLYTPKVRLKSRWASSTKILTVNKLVFREGPFRKTIGCNGEVGTVEKRSFCTSYAVVYNKAVPSDIPKRNKRSLGIVPPGEDYGGYDESKHEEFENIAEARQTRIRQLKKVISSVTFLSVFVLVMWSRNRKQRKLEENTKNAVFLKHDDFFQGSYGSFCVVQTPERTRRTVLPVPVVSDGTINYISSMRFCKGDVVVASFPKAGTTWVQEIVYLLENGLDYKKAASSVLEDRFPYLEYPYPGAKSIDKSKTRRLMKTHLPFEFLPQDKELAKIIYVSRNPKDIVVSYYHFSKMLSFIGYDGNFRHFLELFQKDELPYCPFFEHLESYHGHRNESNVLLLTYEELQKHPHEIIRKIAQFLEKEVTDDQIQDLVAHTSFKAMSSNPSVNYEHWDSLGVRNPHEAKFMRKGVVGDWRNYFSEEDNLQFDSWIRSRNKLNLKFTFEL